MYSCVFTRAHLFRTKRGQQAMPACCVTSSRSLTALRWSAYLGHITVCASFAQRGGFLAHYRRAAMQELQKVKDARSLVDGKLDFQVRKKSANHALKKYRLAFDSFWTIGFALSSTLILLQKSVNSMLSKNATTSVILPSRICMYHV
jgi:hypothetical protein